MRAQTKLLRYLIKDNFKKINFIYSEIYKN